MFVDRSDISAVIFLSTTLLMIFLLLCSFVPSVCLLVLSLSLLLCLSPSLRLVVLFLSLCTLFGVSHNKITIGSGGRLETKLVMSCS